MEAREFYRVLNSQSPETYTVRYWTNPQSLRYGRNVDVQVKARSVVDAATVASIKHPEWSIEGIRKGGRHL